ncbi:valine--tRNA ligase [Peptoniphilus sp. oral taxon 386]|uniref:valine--tRNA ligase n=1 Tax=Peptoniphilus sp. oral taxon 386 TaxID=652713 RepID=UPI0001DAA418|nr:valine--tRNA ligase [Peptoniphilus sp. oral taxon 386]EFI41318.1 valine--tRNA ligase [Peptoniphilus sp. oral taxon 386 str. F0131]
MREISKTYNPKEFEERLYKYWMDNNYFRAEVDSSKKPFTIVMPPPNVTGNLHMGHALNNTIQDILIRTKRMQGYSALWLPGTDHASISTEAKVVEKIKSDGKSKDELGREKFLEEAWKWTDKYGGNIKNQLKKLGVSCDWSRERFTLDDMLSHAVEEVFIRLYEKGLIYRGDRIINWCPNCRTAISDAEVEHEESDGHIWHFRYPLEDGNGYIEVATTRPETIPGDLAVAVNPKDERYADLVGKYVLLPIMNNRRIPIVADEYVEMEFGTGAVKITPSHDPNDFEVGERHNLGQFKVFTDDGHLNENAGKYNGMDRYAARKQIIEDFKALNLFAGEEHHHNAVGHCERCKTIIEPMISKQWFVKMEPLAKPALQAYYDGKLNFVPERFAKVYVNWLENIKDWCISRQLWWGHRLPVFYCVETGEVVVSRTDPTGSPGYENKTFKQDEDTLDTWFSSALWPFSTLGWPEQTEDLKYFYPTDVLVTGYDIIFFWVIRMVFSALEDMGEVPFKDVFFTGLVRDSQGRKMSKSLGNGIDPLEIIDNYGADALRFTLISGNTPGNDMRFYNERVEANRNFANKLWNATRFVLMNLDDEKSEYKLNIDSLKNEDKWILSKLQNLIADVTIKLDKYDMGLAAQEIYDFIWSDYCDWYIEMVKPRLYGEDNKYKESAKAVLLYVLKDILKLLHPFMPYITEEIWQHLPGTETALIVSKWPKEVSDYEFKEEGKAIEYIKEAIRGIRNARAEMNIENSKKSSTIIVTTSDEIKNIVEENKNQLLNLGYSTDVVIISDKSKVSGDNISIVLDGAEIFLPLKDLVDYKKEFERLSKDREQTISEIERATKKLSNESFIAKAPEKVVAEEREKKEKYEKMLKTIEERLESVRENL